MATTSPYGGTTSLPQYLQAKQPDTFAAPKQKPIVQAPTASVGALPPSPTSPGFSYSAGAKGPTQFGQQPAPTTPQPAGPATVQPTPFPVSGTGNPTIPSAPPVAPPAPPATPPAPGQTGQTTPNGPIGMDHLQGLLEQLLGNPNRYNASFVDNLRQQGVNRLDDARRSEEDRLKADAAGRGVYHGSPLTNSLGDVSERYVRGLADNETNVLKQVADAQAADRQSAISNVFQYAQGEQQNQQLQANILSLLASLGGAGGPTIPGAVGDYGSLPAPSQPDYSSIYQLLGSVLAPKPAPAGAAA